MTEEAAADSPIEEHSGGPEGGDVFDMEGAVDTLSADIFGKSDDGINESEEHEEVAEEGDEEVSAKTEKETEKTVETKEEKEEVEKIDLPASWKKDMQEKWEKLDVEAQKYVVERENQMRAGLDKDRVDADLGRTMRDMMKPYDALFQERGIEAPQAVQYLLQAHNILSSGTPEQKAGVMAQLAQSYGVGEQKDVDPQVQNLTQRLQTMEQNLNASHQRSLQEMRTKIDSEVTAFAEEHPLFDDLQDDIVKLIQVGETLEDAYEKALWANPSTRQKELDRLDTQRAAETEKLAKKEVEEAKKAKSVNVKGRNLKKAPTAPLGSMEDTMRETYRNINNRN
jgi:hypothetical protein